MVDFGLSENELEQMKTHYTSDDLGKIPKIELRSMVWSEENSQKANKGKPQCIIPNIWGFAKEYYSLNNSFDGLKAVVENAIDLKNRTFPVEKLHDSYWAIQREQSHKSHVEIYSELKLEIFNKFIDLWDDKETILKELSFFPNAPEKVAATIIKFAIDNTEFINTIMSFCIKYGINEEGLIINKVFSGICIDRKKSNRAQKDLLKKYEQIISNQYSIIKKSDKKLEVIKAPINISDDYNLLFQLYILGHKEREPGAYSWIYTQDDPRNHWDNYIIWFWEWAQKQKELFYIDESGIDQKPVPQHLKEFCRIINYTVADNNTCHKNGGDKYRNKFYDPWDQFHDDEGYAQKSRNRKKSA